ncbi:MAG TPA: efflux RND transporter periplasmic adaptor subunit [Myxococcota bacterium]|nr:efflux RND transporter periplasmic adaptor subunit [Myxococcota bacterium]
MKRSILFVLAAAALTPGCNRGGERPSAPRLVADASGIQLAPDAPQWKYVQLSTAAEDVGLLPLPAPGRIDIDEKQTSNVNAPLAGRVEEVLVRIGDVVKKGDRLLSVRSAAYADLARDLSAAKAEVAVKERVLARITDLFQLRAVPEKDVLAADAELKLAQLALKAAISKQDSLSVAPSGDNLFWVRAPRAGTVVSLDATSGQDVAPGQASLLRISDLDEVLVLADLPEGEVDDLEKGERIMVRTPSGVGEREATIDHISQVVDPQRRTVQIRARIANADRLFRPNAFVEVAPEPNPGARVIKVPETALVTAGDRLVVFVARDAARLEPVPVTTGRRRDGLVELRAGLKPGTRYVSRGAILLLNQLEIAN